MKSEILLEEDLMKSFRDSKIIKCICIILFLTTIEGVSVNNGNVNIGLSVVEASSKTTDNTVTVYTKNKTKYVKYKMRSYKVVKVKGGDTSGERKSNVAVDVGFGNRVYWALTNKYGQLIYVIADKVVLQDDKTESVNSDGRYYDDEAKVAGTEREDLDEGHVIADSLGGVSNAYNITPQNSTLNRHGDQAYMEKVIRDAGGCTDFIATITYSNNKTQIPSHYKFTYKINGNEITDSFDNIDPDEANKTLISVTPAPTLKPSIIPTPTLSPTPLPTPTPIPSNIGVFNELEELRKVDTSGNGKVTIAEAKAAGFSMPIYSSHWLYKYMDDRDGDGKVGE